MKKRLLVDEDWKIYFQQMSTVSRSNLNLSMIIFFLGKRPTRALEQLFLEHPVWS